jgi:hypothetical protein
LATGIRNNNFRDPVISKKSKKQKNGKTFSTSQKAIAMRYQAIELHPGQTGNRNYHRVVKCKTHTCATALVM